jgi:hypothetical protein
MPCDPRDEEILVRALEGDAELYSASVADAVVPKAPGFYSIFVDHPDSLPEPFSAYLQSRGTRLLYIGKASKSLFQRLVEEDLRHQKPSTFFRSIGAVLDYRPQPGSLMGKENQNNYGFSRDDTDEIIDWINQHLAVRFVRVDVSEYSTTERTAIQRNYPVLNISLNPKPFQRLGELRWECRAIARGNTA